MRRNLFLLFAAIVIGGFAVTQYLIFFGTRIDIELLYNQKIFYYHVPCWFVLFGATFICGWSSLKFVRTREGRHDDIAVAAGEVAVIFGLMGLVTGSIWAKTAWEAWWVWDARLTTSLILWMTMLAYVLVRKYGGPGSERLSSGLAIFACVNIPLVYVSVKIWNTNHPKTSTVPSLDGMMRLTFWLSVLLFLILGSLLLAFRIGAARNERRLAEARERGLDAGVLE